jgi:hypothetical protein
MSHLKKLVANGTGILSSLMMVLSPATVPTVAQAQVRASSMTAPAFTCTGNRFTNGDFSQLNPGRTPDAADDQDIDAAVGWKPLWQGGSLADLYSQGVAGTGAAPTPANGNYASMWITNRSVAADVEYREGMYNQLVTPIAANTGTYSFTFKSAPLTGGTGGASTYVGVYGVKQAANAVLPAAPTGVNTPSNLAHFGPNTTVYLGKVEIPTNATNAWQNQTMTFDSATFGGVSGITHVMVTKLDNAPQQTNLRYVAFDDFCMQTSKDHDNDTDGGTGNTTTTTGPCPGDKCTNNDYATCCPPISKFNIKSMFNSVQPTVGSSYHLNMTFNSTLDAQMNAYVALLKTMDPAFTGIATTIRAYNGGTGAAPVLSGAQLEPDKAIYWNAGAPNGVIWPAGQIFTSATDLPEGTWTIVEFVTWQTNNSGRYWSMDCSIKRFAFRPESVNMRRAGGRAGFVDVVSVPSNFRAVPPAQRR